MGQFSNSFPKHFSYLCEYAFRFDLSCNFCEYPFIFHCLHCSPSCFDPHSLLLAHLWLGLSWIYCISANKSFSSPKTSSRKPYTSSKQQERQKHSVETTINFFSLKMGRFGTNNVSKTDEKRIFPKVILDHLCCSNKWFWPILSPWGRVLAPGNSQNALKMGRFGTNNGSKMGQKRVFPKVIPDHLGCSNKCFLARFEPVLTEFSPLKHMYAPLCALRPYLRAVCWSHLELGEGCRLEDIYIYIYIYI